MDVSYSPTLEFTEKDLKEAEKVSLQLLQGTPLFKIQKIPEKNLEIIRYLAFSSYNSGDIEKASQLYQLLCLYEHTNSKNFLGAGICQQKEEQYEDAINSYMTAIMLNNDSYSTYFNLSQCLFALGETKLATEALDQIINIGKRNPEVKSTKTYKKAQNLVKSLKM